MCMKTQSMINQLPPSVSKELFSIHSIIVNIIKMGIK